MHTFRLALAAPLLLVASPVASAEQPLDPLRFFEGRTETEGTVKVMFRKSYRTHSTGLGRIEGDGSLTLIQQVKDEGKPAHERRWHVRRTAPGEFTATMSQAVGPVSIERMGDRYRFRFRMKDNLHVEQILDPLPGGRSAKSNLKVRKLGVVVATTTGIVRKI